MKTETEILKVVLAAAKDGNNINLASAEKHYKNLETALQAMQAVVGNNDSIAARYREACLRLLRDKHNTANYIDSLKKANSPQGRPG